MPAAHQRSAMFPFCQFFTLREWVRAIDIIDSIAVVERSAELAESSRRSHPGRNYSSPIASSLPAMTTLHMLDNIWFMVIIYTAMNLPIAIWMLRSFLADVPPALFEAASIDGANLVQTLRRIIVPIISPGIAPPR